MLMDFELERKISEKNPPKNCNKQALLRPLENFTKIQYNLQCRNKAK